MQALVKLKDFFSEVKLYWRSPRPGEYVPYREVLLLSLGWGAMRFATTWSLGFGVGNQFTGMTLHMTNNELLIMGYICAVIGYVTTALNAWIVDNLRSKSGKYRVYIKLAVPSMLLTLLSLWFPYEGVRDSGHAFSRIFMILSLFFIGQIQGYIQGWFITGMTNMIHVMTPNTQERTKIMSITSIIYNFAPSVTGLYFPIMVDILAKDGNKYTVNYFRGTYTPLAFFAPLALLAYFGTKERLILPKSRITKISFTNSLRAVAGNKIFWIRCIDSWNDFLENAKGDIWNWLVYRAHIMKSSTYGVLNTIAWNSTFWSMLVTPFLIKKFGKKKIKIFKNTLQTFLIVCMLFVYKTKIAVPALFLITVIDRFFDRGEVIDKAIEADMRDSQQYLVGERIDGAFGFIQTYMGGAINMVTNLFLPWVYKKKGFDGSDYSVLDVYTDFDPEKPLAQQTKNPDCVLYPMLDTLIKISIFGAIVDIIPWFFYDVSEKDQKSMIRVLRIRTMLEDYNSAEFDEAMFLEGCTAIFKAREHFGKEKIEIPSKNIIKEAKALPKTTEEEKKARSEAVTAAKKSIEDAKIFNEEVEIAEFVMHELNRFSTEYGKKQLELARLIISGGDSKFYNCYEDAIVLAHALPSSNVKEEKIWRKQDVKMAASLKKSKKLAEKHYPDGKVTFDPQVLEDAYDLPDNTKQESKIRRKAMRDANKAKNIYATVASPYLTALRIVNLSEKYEDIDTYLDKFDSVSDDYENKRKLEFEQNEKISNERRIDRQRREANKRIKAKRS